MTEIYHNSRFKKNVNFEYLIYQDTDPTYFQILNF